AESTGFQVLGADLGNYGYYWDYARPGQFGSGWKAFSEWTELRPQELLVSWTSMYAVGEGQLAVGAGLSTLDQLDGQPTNDVVLATINSTPASTSVSLRQTIFPPNPHVGEVMFFVTEIR